MVDAITHEEAAAIVRQAKADPLPPLVSLTAHELLARDFPPRELVLRPWLPEKGLAMIFGPRGIGKTHLTLGIGYAIATGGTFLRWQAPRPRRVLILDGEMPAVTLRERLAEVADAAPLEPPSRDHLRFLALDLQERGLDLSAEAQQHELAPHLDGADVILADNISTLCQGGRENEAESWLPVQQWALAQRRAGRSVVFMHHAGKGGAQRGTSRREDVLDTVIALRRPEDYDPAEGARFDLLRDLAEADLARVVALTGEGNSVRDIAAETGWTRSRVSRLQARARELGLMDTAGHG